MSVSERLARHLLCYGHKVAHMHALFIQPVIDRNPGLGQRIGDLVKPHASALHRSH